MSPLSTAFAFLLMFTAITLHKHLRNVWFYPGKLRLPISIVMTGILRLMQIWWSLQPMLWHIWRQLVVHREICGTKKVVFPLVLAYLKSPFTSALLVWCNWTQAIMAFSTGPWKKEIWSIWSAYENWWVRPICLLGAQFTAELWQQS